MKTKEEQGCLQTAPFDTEKQKTVVKAVKSLCTSPAALIALITYTAAIVIIMLVTELDLSNTSFDFVRMFLVMVMGLAIVISLVFGSFYFVKAVQTINTMKRTVVSGIPSYKVSVFVAVSSIISGGYTAISLPVNTGVMMVLTSLCTAAASITFGVFLFIYRNKMRLLMLENPS